MEYKYLIIELRPNTYNSIEDELKHPLDVLCTIVYYDLCYM